MDKIASAKWVSELEMEGSTFLNRYETKPPDSDEDFNFLSFSSKSYSSYPNFLPDHQNGNNTNRTVTAPRAPSFASSHLISFDKSNSSPPTTSHQHFGIGSTIIPMKLEMSSYGESSLISKDDLADPKTCSPEHGQGIERAARSPSQRRRENLSQQFIALSALLPGLKKINKTSVLEEAAEYVKRLKKRITILEEQASKKKAVQSVVLVRKTQYPSGDDDDDLYPYESFHSCSDRRLPEIEARFLEREVLIRIHCEKKRGCLANI